MLTDIICGVDACPVEIIFMREALLTKGCRKRLNLQIF